MARIGLKLYFLRTRKRQESQQAVANAIGIRQATISNIEQGASQPSCALLLELCRYFDVTPSYLIDPDRGLEPRATEHWSRRDALVTTGMWIETPAAAIEENAGDTRLCPLLPGHGFFDGAAYAIRRRTSAAEAEPELARLARTEQAAEEQLAMELETELDRRPRRRKK